MPLALAAALLAAAPGDASAKRVVPPLFFGSNWDDEVMEKATDDIQVGEAERMAKSGVESQRLAFQWAFAQPNEGAPFDYAKTDRAVKLAVTHGIDVLPVVILAPMWARRYPDEPYSPPKKIADYTRYLRALIDRYGPNGSFWVENPLLPKRPIRQWQIWNEPHLQYQWWIPKGQDYAPGYGKLLRSAYKTVKAADPGALVVLAGLVNDSWTQLGHLYDKGRIKGAFDVAALHPYTGTARGVITLTKRFRGVLRAHGDAKRQLWITELGLPASKGRSDIDPELYTDDKGMAVHLERSYKLLVKDRSLKDVNVQRVYWYTWASSYSVEPFRYTGLVRYDQRDHSITEMPALPRYVYVAQLFEGCVKDEQARCR